MRIVSRLILKSSKEKYDRSTIEQSVQRKNTLKLRRLVPSADAKCPTQAKEA